MLDNSGAPDPTPATPAPEPAPAPAPEPAPLLGGVGDPPSPDGGDGGDPGEGAWRDDWRDRLVEKLPAAEREKEAARLKRFASPENVYKSLRELERKQSAGQLKTALPENPTPEEVTAYRKANGIPEAADGYGLSFGEDASAEDTAMLTGFAKHMHDQNVPPAAVKAAFEWFNKNVADTQSKLDDAASERVVANQAELRAEYGKEFKANVTMADRFISQYAGEDGKDLMKVKLADGTSLGDHPAFVRFAVNAARDTAEDGLLVEVPGGGATSMVDRYKALMGKSGRTAAENAEAQELAIKMEQKGINFSL